MKSKAIAAKNQRFKKKMKSKAIAAKNKKNILKQKQCFQN